MTTTYFFNDLGCFLYQKFKIIALTVLHFPSLTTKQK